MNIKLIVSNLQKVNSKLLKVPQAGFTFIELIVVFSIVAVITTVGLASFNAYSGRQSFQASVADFVNVLNTAKSRSLSQVKPPQCANKQLVGYEVKTTGAQYTLNASCGTDTYVLSTKVLPTGISFVNGSSSSVLFSVSSGTVVLPGKFAFNGNGKAATVVVGLSGSVTVSEGVNLP